MKKLLFLIASLSVLTLSATELRIFNQQIDENHGSVYVANELDFLKEGTILWNGSTLTLSNVVIEGATNQENLPIISLSKATTAVTIKLCGKNVITDYSNSRCFGMELDGKTTIVCENENIHNAGVVSSLELNSGKSGIRLSDNASLTIDRVDFIINSPNDWGIINPSGSGNAKLEIKNDSRVEINGSSSKDVIRESGLTVTIGNKLAISEPAGAQLSNGKITLNGSPVKGRLVIDRLEWEASDIMITTKTAINNLNAANLEKWYPEIITAGKVSWDNDKKVLTLDNATIAPSFSDYGISISGNADVTIELKGKNDIITQRQGLYLVKGAKLKVIANDAEASLDINASNHYGIDAAANCEVTLSDVNLHISGSGYGIYGRDKTSSVLNINNSEVVIEAADKAVLDGFKEAKLTDCKVLEPQGAIVVAGSAYNSQGELLTERLVIGNEKVDALELVSSDEANLLENPAVRIYNIVGQDVTSLKNSLPQGNYILRAGNKVQKICVK